MFKEKIEVLKYANKVLRCADGSCIKVPLIIRLIKIVRMIYKNKVPFSKRNIIVRDGFRCVYCNGIRKLTIDHIIPTSRGGKSSFENCTTACRKCNSTKGNRTPSEAKIYMTKPAYAPTISEFLRMKMKQLGVDAYLKEMGVF